MEQDASQLIRNLQNKGVKFKSFQLKNRGRYSVGDADWNYKDVPHLAIIHKLVDATLASVTETHVASINLQKILGLRFPVTVYNYQPKSTAQTYFTTLFFYVLVIETVPKRINEHETEVTTTYNIGAMGFWMIFFPILRWLLKRNYDDLMSGDIPMRARRGEIRDWGYELLYDTKPCGFESTMNIMKTNVWPGPGMPAAVSAEGSLAELKAKGVLHLGRSDLRGLKLRLDDGKVSVFPRMCPHEGASLDESPCENGQVRCPWHGRPFAALAKFDLSDSFNVQLKEGTLSCANGIIAYHPKSIDLGVSPSVN